MISEYCDDLLEEAMLLAIGQEQLSVIEKLMIASITAKNKEGLYEKFIKHALLMVARFDTHFRVKINNYIFEFLFHNLIEEKPFKGAASPLNEKRSSEANTGGEIVQKTKAEYCPPRNILRWHLVKMYCTMPQRSETSP